ncbi:MAG: hypothetical protein FWF85_00770 [Clostridiales bacterium]|nr:hypothetical protein [Clostridiales bacterium]
MYKSNYKRVLSAVLVVVMLLGMLPVTSFSAATGAIGQAELLSAIPDLDFVIEENSLELVEIVAFEEDFAPGYGSNGKFLAPIGAPDDDSLPISTRAQLEAIGNDATSLGGKYHLINDIDLGGSGWAPIGSYNTSFTGTFDGQGYVIRNLTIAGNIYQYAGLFGYANIGTIRNVGLEDTHINDSYTPSFGRPHAGGICGIIVGSSSIFNCYNTGYVSTSDFAGGICGSISDNASISNCYNLGDIYSYSSSSSTACMAGGICGTSAGAISNSYNT